HARVDGLARGGEQVRAHAARRVRAALLLPQRHHVDDGGGGQLGHHQGPYPQDDRHRGPDASPVGRADRRDPGPGWPAPGPAHRGEVPRGAPHPALTPTQVRPRTPGRSVSPPATGGGSVQIEYTGRQTDVTPALKTLAERKLKKLERVLGRVTRVHVVLAVDKHRQFAEVTVHSPHLTLAATEESG